MPGMVVILGSETQGNSRQQANPHRLRVVVADQGAYRRRHLLRRGRLPYHLYIELHTELVVGHGQTFKMVARADTLLHRRHQTCRQRLRQFVLPGPDGQETGATMNALPDSRVQRNDSGACGFMVLLFILTV